MAGLATGCLIVLCVIVMWQVFDGRTGDWLSNSV